MPGPNCVLAHIAGDGLQRSTPCLPLPLPRFGCSLWGEPRCREAFRFWSTLSTAHHFFGGLWASDSRFEWEIESNTSVVIFHTLRLSLTSKDKAGLG